MVATPEMERYIKMVENFCDGVTLNYLKSEQSLTISQPDREGSSAPPPPPPTHPHGAVEGGGRGVGRCVV